MVLTNDTAQAQATFVESVGLTCPSDPLPPPPLFLVPSSHFVYIFVPFFILRYDNAME